MLHINLKPLHHRGKLWIGIYYEKQTIINNLLQKELKAKWSSTCKCWYTRLDKEHYLKLRALLKGKAEIEVKELRTFLLTQKKNAIPPKVITLSVNGMNAAQKKTTVNEVAQNFFNISDVNAGVLTLMKEQMTLKAMSNSTMRTYLNEMAQLLSTIKNVKADDLTPADLKRYLLYCFENLKLKENTIHSRLNAMKFYYEQVLKREKFFWQIPRPKKPFLLPKLLNERELGKLFNALTNKKHKAMLFTVYSAGLRVSEIVNLKIADIDSKRMQLFIERAKGKKDRYINLSPVLLDILRAYIRMCKPRPLIYLFESEQTLSAYPVRTVQQIFSNAKTKAGIIKNVGIHSLRHSFATHLLDKGTDIRYIKDLLGHFDIRTTERYLHVSKQQLVNVISPLDDLFKKEELDW